MVPQADMAPQVLTVPPEHTVQLAVLAVRTRQAPTLDLTRKTRSHRTTTSFLTDIQIKCSKQG